MTRNRLMRAVRRPALPLLAVLVVLGATSCRDDTASNTTRAAGTTGAGATTTTSGTVKTDKGVSDSEITIGAITDLTGPFAAQGKSSSQGLQLAVDEINANGGICGRQVKLLIEDFAFNVQQGVTAYQKLEPQVVAIVHTLSAPLVNQLMPTVSADKMLTLGTPLASHLVNPYVVVLATLFSIDMVNGITEFAKAQNLQPGDTLAFIYFEGPVGAEAVKGVEYIADKLGLNVFSQQVKVTDADLTAQLTAARDREAKALVVATAPAQLASILSVSTGAGYTVPVLAATYSFDPSLLNTPAKEALESRVEVVGSYAAYASSDPGPTKVRTLFEQKYPDEPRSFGLMYAFAQGTAFGQFLKTACDNRDLTREGVQKAMTSLKAVDTEGLVPVLDYSRPGEPPARQSYLARPDSTVDGRLRVTKPFFVVPDAETYK